MAVALLNVLNPRSQLEKSRDARRKKDLNQLVEILENYYSDYKRYPDVASLDLKVCNSKLDENTLPCDPLNEGDQYYCYVVSDDGQKYKVYAKLERENDPEAKTGLPVSKYNYGISSSNISLEEAIPSAELPAGFSSESDFCP
jgi:hypothetical protein